MGNLSTFLFARPSFVEGVARILDFGNTMQEYNQSPTEQIADMRAILADWRSVGADLESAAATLLAQQGQPNVQAIEKKK